MKRCKWLGKHARYSVSNATCCAGVGQPFSVRSCSQPEVVEFENGECCLNGEARNLRSCETCELKEVQAFTPDAEYQQRLTWEVVVRLAPRETRYIERTIESLRAAGWTTGTIFAEPGIRSPAIEGWRVIQHREKLGSYRNFVSALRHASKQQPDAILSIEDDIVICRGAMQWLESVLWPAPDVGVLSLYTASHQTGGATDGQWMREQMTSPWGTLAQVFRPDAAADMVASELAQHWHSDIGEDQFVWRSMQTQGQRFLSCVPSLVQHVGDDAAIERDSSTAAAGKRQAADFVGEDYDARERIDDERRAPEWSRPIEAAEEASVEDAVMFGITHFDRPDALRRCVSSIRQWYPRAEIVVANTGRLRVPMVGVQQIDLPFDAGLSAARNALADHCSHQYYAILEEDFDFISYTKLGALLHVLRDRPDIQMAAGSVIQNGAVLNYDRDLHLRSDGWLFGEHAKSELEHTEAGIGFRPCDMVLNFGVCRAKWARAVQWDEQLKVGEHFEFFLRSSQTGYVVAHVPGVMVRHLRVRPAGYAAFRGRAKEMHEIVYRKHGLRGHTMANDDERQYGLPAGVSRRGPVPHIRTELTDGVGDTAAESRAIRISD